MPCDRAEGPLLLLLDWCGPPSRENALPSFWGASVLGPWRAF